MIYMNKKALDNTTLVLSEIVETILGKGLLGV